jgi:hypothetical protein
MSKGIILVEAESFSDFGGWALDQQFMDQMGSPYLLAHGLGKPVKDATTAVTFPETGRYRVFARTKDWVAHWNAPGAPGKFQITVDGKTSETVFGTESAEWHWQDGGIVEIKNRNVKIALHDLTGFDGRCDAILFCADAKFTPPGKPAELAAFRKKALGFPEKPEDAGTFDLVVVGGGIAGECAAISGARSGLKVAFIHDRPVLGGNNSSEVRVGLSGEINLPPYPSLGNIVREIAPVGYYDFIEADKNPEDPESRRILAMDPVKRIHNAGPASNYDDNKKFIAVKSEKNISLFLNTHAVGIEKKEDKITAIVGKNIRTGRELSFKAALFVDCTGDGTLGFLAGAEFRMGREGKDETGESIAPDNGDNMTMGSSVQWYSEERKQPVEFPECPWAVQFNDETAQKVKMGEWDWETGMNRDQINEFELVRDYALRVVYGNWAFMKNKSSEIAKFANSELSWVAYLPGKRESRRLMGDVVLCQQDIESAKAFPDACVVTTWTIDLHYPSPENTRYFPGEEFRSIARHVTINPYPIPYRTLYSRNVGNLFMAGRNISVTHVALGTVRVMRTTGMMGEVVGMAAALCVKHKTTPRGVYEKHLAELIDILRN